MTKKAIPCCLICLIVGLAVPTIRGQSVSTLHFHTDGFSIASLETAPGGTAVQPLTMCLPEKDGFAANVNVQIQPFAGSIDDYSSLTVAQFKTAGFKLLQFKTTEKTLATYEYTGTVQGRVLHWYQRAERYGGSVYLTTATAPDDQWSELAPRLKACVDSFKIEGGSRSSQPAATSPGR